MLVFGHRGNCVPGPENTPAAVLSALAAGADGVEIDIRRSDALEPLVRHDPLESPVGLPSLPDMLDLCRGRGRIICEIKNRAGEPDFDAPVCRTAEATVSLLAGRTGDDVVVSSFDWHSLELVKTRAAEIPTAFLTPPGVTLAGGLSYAAGAGHAELHAHVSAVLNDPEAVPRVRDAGLRLVAWTVTEVDQALRLRDLGVDGVICDDPAGVVAGLAA